jgi:hypothetical protein
VCGPLGCSGAVTAPPYAFRGIIGEAAQAGASETECRPAQAIPGRGLFRDVGCPAPFNANLRRSKINRLAQTLPGSPSNISALWHSQAQKNQPA